MHPPILTRHEADVVTPGTAGSRLSPESRCTYMPAGHFVETSPDLVELRKAVAAWTKLSFAPLDVELLDPPSVCERCRRPIASDEAIDYLVGDDESLTIIHETCPASPPLDRAPIA